MIAPSCRPCLQEGAKRTKEGRSDMSQNHGQERAQGCGGTPREPGEGLPKEALHPESSVKTVIGVISGKGGVGKSFVTALLATSLQRKGYRTAILDADITGPSIPRAFGLEGLMEADREGKLYPRKTKTGIQVVSMNLLLKETSDPVIWRGPLIGNMVKQFWSEVIWQDVDVMLVDMPPGTGDVALTVLGNLPLDGIVVVTSPQELVSMIVEKAVRMARDMDVPVLGLVENMSYFQCPGCETRHAVLGESKVEGTAARFGIPHWIRMPLDPRVAAASDAGTIETIQEDWLDPVIAGFPLAK